MLAEVMGALDWAAAALALALALTVALALPLALVVVVVATVTEVGSTEGAAEVSAIAAVALSSFVGVGAVHEATLEIISEKNFKKNTVRTAMCEIKYLWQEVRQAQGGS